MIAGGGPVGCIAALALARAGFPVQLFEAQPRVNDSPRAATTHAATLEMLAELGLVDEVMRRGLIEPKFRIWDRASRYETADLCKRASGSALDPAHFKSHLETRYL